MVPGWVPGRAVGVCGQEGGQGPVPLQREDECGQSLESGEEEGVVEGG